MLLALYASITSAAVAPRKTVPPVAVGFNDDTIAKVEANLLKIATHRSVVSFLN
jgi:hypothetical protein